MDHLAWLEQRKAWLVEKGGDFAINLIVFLLILVVGRFIIKALLKVSRTMLKKSGRVTETLQRFLINVLSKVLWVVLLMLALPRVGVDIAPLIAGLGVTGFIIGFAFQESLGNLASGLMIILNQPFKVGDFIDASGHKGAVKEINMMATTLLTPDNKRIIIPNSSIWGGPVVNFTAQDTRRVDLTVGVSYLADIGKARDTIAAVVKADAKVLADPATQIEVVEMADSSVNLVVRPWVKTEDYWDVYFSLMRGIKETLDREGIEIPFPQIDVHHHNAPSVA